MKRLALALALAAGLAGSASSAHAQDAVTLKFGSLAPDGSSWANLLKQWGREVEEHTGGKVKVKFYLGGQSGDERDYVRKIKLGNLSGAVITAIGLGLIQPEVRALELPMMIRTDEELDFVRTKLDG
jgi:TRAP-type C4-dicarboxylate transport system substrate-binding protein